MEYKQETNKFKRLWIWLWYNDITRLSIMIGLPLIPMAIICIFLFGGGEYLRYLLLTMYTFLICWMLIDNDYSNLRRIGMNEYRERI